MNDINEHRISVSDTCPPPVKTGIALALVIAGFCAGGIAGGYYSFSQILTLKNKNRQLVEQLALTENKTTGLTQKITNLELGKKIDHIAGTEAMNTINSLENTISQLEEDIAFYKNIMSPSAGEKGLQIQRMEIHSSREKERFQYKLVLTQMAENTNDISGLAAVNFIGTRSGKKEILSLKDVGGEDDAGLKFKFRYFQDFTGTLVIPANFNPLQVQVIAKTTAGKSAKIERTFDWKVME